MEAELTDMPLPPYDASGGDDDQPFDVCQVRINYWYTLNSEQS